MITKYDINKSMEIGKPVNVMASHFIDNESRTDVDYYYGPYGAPDSVYLFFTYREEDQEQFIFRNYHRPSANEPRVKVSGDGIVEITPGGTYYDAQNNEVVVNSNTPHVLGTNESVYVYPTKLDYEKGLAKFNLSQGNQFFPGKRVAFTDELNKPIEYTVIESANPGEYEFCESSMVDIYTIIFNPDGGVDGVSGGMLETKVCGRYYTLPKSDFIAPTYEVGAGLEIPTIFVGWATDEDYTGEPHAVNKLIDLSEYDSDKNKIVELYPVYEYPQTAYVDFQNGYYVGDVWKSLDIDGKNNDTSGYVKVNMSQSQKPHNWSNEYKSYFTISEPKPNTTFVRIQWGEIGDWESYMSDEYSWDEEHAKGAFANPNDNPTDVVVNYNGGGYSYVYIKDENEIEDWPDELKRNRRKWYKRVAIASHLPQYVPNTELDWVALCENHKQLYRQIVVDKIATYINGGFSEVSYDCVYNTAAKTITPATVQIQTDLNTEYAGQFEFDHWEICYSGNNDTLTLFKKFTTKTASFILNAKSGDNYVTEYIMKAVYREKPVCANVYVRSNNSLEYPLGSVDVYTTYLVDIQSNNVTETKALHVATLDTQGALTVDDGIIGVEKTNDGQGGESYLRINTLKYNTIFLTAVPNNENIDPQAADYVKFLKWKGAVENVNATIQLSLEPENTYTVKAYFLRNDDTNAYVNVARAMTYAGTNNKSFNGSDVKIYPVEYVQVTYVNSTTGELVESIAYNTVCGNRHYMDDVVGETIKTQHRFRGVTKQVSGNEPTGIGNFVLRKANSPVETRPYMISIANGPGYCYIEAVEGDSDNSLPFVCWSDGNTNKERLIEVDVPGSFTYKAYFQTKPSPENPTPVGPAVGGEVGITNAVEGFIEDNGSDLPWAFPPANTGGGNGTVPQIVEDLVYSSENDVPDEFIPTRFNIVVPAEDGTTVTKTFYTYDPEGFVSGLSETAANTFGASDPGYEVDTNKGTVTETTTTKYYSGYKFKNNE